MSSIEELKTNFSLLERNILDDAKDPTEDIQLALTWIAFIEDPNRTDPEKALFFNEALPKILKAVFSRKYESVKINLTAVYSFVERAAALLARSLARPEMVLYREIPISIKELLDSGNLFYKKCATLMANKQAESDRNDGKKVDNSLFIDSLEAGNYVDYFNPNSKKWEPIQIERFSEYRTECEICLPNETKLWIGLDQHMDNIAPFGTKTSFSDSSTADASVDSKLAVVTKDAASVVDVSDDSWKSALKVGDLVDFKDRNGTWFQACILDIEERTEEAKQATAYVVTEPISPPTVTVAAVPQPLADSQKINSISDFDDIYDSTSSKTSLKEKPLENVVAAPDSIDVNVVTDDDVKKFVSDPQSDLEVDPVVIADPAVIADTCQECRIAEKDIRLVVKKVARVAIVGMPEKFDEWIDLKDERIQKLNSLSFGRRGENPIREEVAILATANRSETDSDVNSPDAIAVFNHGNFVDKFFVKVVNVFGTERGFHNVLVILRRAAQEDIIPSEEKSNGDAHIWPSVPFSSAIQLIVAVGNVGKVLSKNFLSSFAEPYLHLSAKVLTQMTLADIRETAVETLEQVLSSIESLAVAAFDRTEVAGSWVEPLKLDTAIRHILSPFLNRRLGGLKILTELVRRANNAVEYPSGWRISRSVNNGEDNSSYSVVHILYSLTLPSITAKLSEKDVMATLFEGAASHESLMQRAGPVLRAIAINDQISPALLDSLWSAGVMEKKSEALKVFVELIDHLNSSLLPVVMQRIIDSLKESIVSVNVLSLIQLTSAVVARCRSVLVDKEWEITDSLGLDHPNRRILDIYNEGTEILLKFVVHVDFDEAISAQSLQRLESIVIVKRPSTEDANHTFLWRIQFFLLVPLIERAIRNIANNVSVCHMLRLLQVLLIGWPQAPKKTDVCEEVMDHEIPKIITNRSELVKYLESTYGVIEVVTNSILLLKRDYNNALFQYLSNFSQEISPLFFLEKKTAEDISDLTSTTLGLFPLEDSKLDESISSLKVGNSRFSYTEHLSRLFDFIHLYARCSDALQLSLSTIEKVCAALAHHSVTVIEHDIFISFIDRLVYKHATTISSANVNDQSAEASKDKELPKRKAVTSRETLKWVFLNVLCDEASAGLLRSKLFSTKTFNCVEKWFVWLNADLGYIKETGSLLSVVENTASLLGSDVFLKIILTCPSDGVALQSVKFLSLLPQNFSPELIAAGAATAFRMSMLSKCMDELQQLHGEIRQNKIDIKTPLRLPRIIMFLEGILEESQSISDYRIIPHGTIGVGPSVIFNISSTSKRLKQYKGDISMRTHQTVGDLMESVAKQVHLNVSEIRVYRLGKQITSDSFSKTIAQLHMLGTKESLVVAEWPLATNASVHPSPMPEQEALSESKPQIELEIPNPLSSGSPSEKDRASIPALVLANSKTYFNLLFTLLEECSGSACDKLWALITKLPTPLQKLNQWAQLDCDNVTELLMDFEFKNSKNPAHLLYNLQLVEVFIQPSESANELELQREYIGDIDHSLLISWPDRFDKKRGLPALCGAFEWLESTLKIYIQEGDARGVTSSIFQQTTALMGKIIRGFFVRYTTMVASKAAVEKVLTSRSTCSVPLTTSATLPEKAVIGCEPRPKTETIAAIPEITSLVSTEWGWRIHISDADIGMPILHLQKILINLISLLRKLGDHVDYITLSNESSVKTKFAVKHSGVVMILEDLLIVWKCCIVCETGILQYFKRGSEKKDPIPDEIDTVLLVMEVILGQYSRTSSYQINTKLGQMIVEWFITAVAEIIKYQNWYVQDLIHTEKYFFNFQIQLLLTFLELRVPFSNMSEKDTQTSFYKGASAMFHLASSIADVLPTGKISSSPLLSNAISHACEDIMRELVEASKSLTSWTTSTWGDIQEGNLELLQHLASKSDYDWFGHDNEATQRMLDFFILTCLGIVPVKSCNKNIICKNDNSRKYVYQLLLDFCSRNPSQGKLLHKYVQNVHAQLPPPSSLEFRPERESKSSTGYVGLRNMGSTCYMNSLLQIMYMNIDIRNYFLDFFPQSLPENISDADKANNVFLQLKRLFYHLKWSEKKSFLPSDWTYAFKDETGVNPINVMQQQDAQEFLQIFCDRIDQCHKLLVHQQSSSAESSVNLLEGFFGGKICNQMFQTSPPANGKPEIREQEESFVCISLEVKGVKNLEASLEKFVAGEQINDYLWNENDKSSARENITKRQCFSQLSNTIIFHLKRFELNFDTFRREKVNDFFPFPMALDMRPYTKVGLAGNSESAMDYSYFEYELGGVVVHTGTADSGHYYSYIKEDDEIDGDVNLSVPVNGETAKKRRWLEFNDSEVSEFYENRIENECFGGTTKSHEYIPSTQSLVTTETTNPKNAYMLVYHRKKKVLPFPTAPAFNFESADAQRGSVFEVFKEMQKLKSQIEYENATQLLNVRILSSNHFEFYFNFIRRCLDEFREGSMSQDELGSTLYETFILIVFFLSHTTLISQYKNFIKFFQLLLEAHRDVEKDKKDTKIQMPPANTAQITGPFSPIAENDEEVVVFQAESKDMELDSKQPQFNSKPDDSAGVTISVPQKMLAVFLHDIEKLGSILYASREEIRTEAVAMVLQIFSTVFEQEGKLAFLDQSKFDVSFGLMTGSVAEMAAVVTGGPARSEGPMAVALPVAELEFATVEEEEDEDLLLAIKMSQEGLSLTASATPEEIDEAVPQLVERYPAASTAYAQLEVEIEPSAPPLTEPVVVGDNTQNMTGGANVLSAVNIFDSTVDATKLHVYTALCPRFIIAVTTNEKMQFLTENWRKSGSVQLLLCELAKMNSIIAEFLVSRQLISQIVDTILGNQSPISGVLYEAQRRKRAPTSYTSVYRTKDGTLSVAARNGPDWTSFLLLLSTLVQFCKTQELYVGSRSIMSEWDSQCINTKTLYTTLLRQYRYLAPAVSIITQLSFENKTFSDLICEVLFEEFSLATVEGLAHIFIVLESFLTITDSWTMHRCQTLFGGDHVSVVAGGNNLNILELIAGMKEQSLKVKFVCAFIRSFAALVRQVGRALTETVSKPLSRVSVWAPWMLKVVYRYMNQCNNGAGNVADAIAASANASSNCSSSSGSSWPYIFVYGEEESDREISWASRAEKTFAELNALIISAGANPDTLIPDDTFAAVDSTVPTTSDEDLARYFQNAESFGHELDID